MVFYRLNQYVNLETAFWFRTVYKPHTDACPTYYFKNIMKANIIRLLPETSIAFLRQ